MSASQEKINIIFMRDSGDSKRFRMLRSRFRCLLVLCILSPCVAAAAVAGCYYLWQANVKLHVQQQQLEKQNRAFAITTKRLKHLEALLEKEKNVESAIMLNVAKENVAAKAVDLSAAQVQSDLQKEGPGHEPFPELNSGVLDVENVSASVLEKDRLRIAFNLRNKGSQSISGKVHCILSLADGKTVPLSPSPEEAAAYKITNFKSAVLFTTLEQEFDLVNAQIILEVKDDKDQVVYRNIYPLTQ